MTGAFAAGAFGSITSHSWSDQRLSMEQTQQHMEDAGAALTLPETIGDFTFSHGYDVAATAKSATGKSEQVDEVNAEYEKDGVTLNFNAHKTYTVFSDEENSDPEPDEVQCALAWYTGAFADRERQLGVEILLDALLGTNQSPLKAALLEQKLGADIDLGFDDSTLQPTLELVLRGATAETAPKFAAGVKQAVTDLLAGGIPEELLLASLNAAEFASLERPGSLPDGVLDAIHAATGWLHAGDPTLLLHTNQLFAALREKFNNKVQDIVKQMNAALPQAVKDANKAAK